MPPLTIPSGNKRLMGAGSRSSTEPVAQKLFASARATVKTSLEVGNAENTSLADTPTESNWSASREPCRRKQSLRASLRAFPEKGNTSCVAL